MAHKNCPHTDVSGWGVVEVVSNHCEVGEGCPGLKAGCPYAWKQGDWKRNRIANRIFADFCAELARQPLMSIQS